MQHGIEPQRARLRGRYCIITLLASALLSGTTTLLSSAAAAEATRIAPAMAADFVLKGVDGRNLRLSEYRGAPVIVSFWGSWCGPCRENLAALNRPMMPAPDTPVLGISLDDDAERASAVASALRLQFPTLLDTRQAVARDYDVQKLPLTLLIDHAGVIRASWSGMPVDRAELNRRLDALRREE